MKMNMNSQWGKHMLDDNVRFAGWCVEELVARRLSELALEPPLEEFLGLVDVEVLESTHGDLRQVALFVVGLKQTHAPRYTIRRRVLLRLGPPSLCGRSDRRSRGFERRASSRLARWDFSRKQLAYCSLHLRRTILFGPVEQILSRAASKTREISHWIRQTCAETLEFVDEAAVRTPKIVEVPTGRSCD